MTDVESFEPIEPAPSVEPAAPVESAAPVEPVAPVRPAEPVAVEEPVPPAAPVVVEEMQVRSASDAYVFAALLCAVVGVLIPILPAAAALMLLRATDEDLAGEPLRPQLQGVASFARGLAWFDLAWMTLITVALLLGILGRVIA